MLWSGSETPEHQQDSSTRNAKRMPKNSFTSPLEPIKKSNALVRFRNTRTPAGPVPKHPNTSRSRAHGTHVTLGQCFGPVPKRPNTRRIQAHATPRKTHAPSFGPVPKHPNPSRKRAHATQNACQKTLSRHLWSP